MTVTTTQIVSPRYVELDGSDLYEAGEVTIIDAMTLANVSGAAATVSVRIGPDFPSIFEKVLGAGKSYLCPEIVGHTLRVGDTLWASADTADAVTVVASGRLVTND